MIQRKLALFTLLLLWSAILWGAELKITWREGKDNLYHHPARLQVTTTAQGKPAVDATVYRGSELLGRTDKQGLLTTSELNTAAVKYTLKACLNDQCSDKTTYQVVASEFPFPTFISMGEDPSNSMAFTWHTMERVKVTLAECVKAEDTAGFQSQQSIRTNGTSMSQELTDVDKPEGKKYAVTVHKAAIKGLSPDTRYKYRVGDGKNWQEGNFVTAPEADSKATIKFLFTADSQESTRENSQAILKPILHKAFELNPDIRFMVHGGDMVNRGMNGQEWGWFFESGEQYFRYQPMASVVGNHETGGVVTAGPQQENKIYLAYFNNPANHTGIFSEGSTYSFNYGAAHLTCLDNQNLSDAMEIKAKTGEGKYLQSAVAWIMKDLEAATAQKKWKIVVMHQPIYAANRDEKEFREVLAPIFDSCKVDLVITGHDHYYFRSFPLRYNRSKNDGEPVTMDQFGTIHIVGGSTSSKMYPQKYARPYQAVVLAKEQFPGRYPFQRSEVLPLQNYSTFIVNQEELHYQFFDRNGKKMDELLLRRGSSK